MKPCRNPKKNFEVPSRECPTVTVSPCGVTKLDQGPKTGETQRPLMTPSVNSQETSQLTSISFGTAVEIS